ncbi:hypothetical protein [Streptomyces albidoflavus]|uniref:hypothetical protein n=1 Tax=Streptomyces albidoflavus TaxID=1886 RepID=UPI0033A485C2
MPHVPVGLDAEGHCVCPVRRAPRTPRRRPRTALAPYAARHLHERAPRRVPRSAVRSAPRARRPPPLPTAPRTLYRVTHPAPN